MLAAGHGVRMRPLTLRRAKPSLPALGTSLVGRTVLHLRSQGLFVTAVNAFHSPESIARALERDAPPAPPVLREPVLMGTGGALDAPRDELAAGDVFLLHNGDTLVDAPAGPLLEAARSPGCLGALLVRTPAMPGYTPLGVRRGRVQRIGGGALEDGAPETSATYLGVAAFRREVLERVPRNEPCELFEDVVLPLMRERGEGLATVDHDGRWLEFTSPAAYRGTLCALLHREARAGEPIRLPGGDAAVHRTGEGWLFRADGATADGIRVHGAAVVESGAAVGGGSRMEDSVALEGASISDACVIRRSIVAPGARLEPGRVVEDAIALEDGTLEPLTPGSPTGPPEDRS